MAVRFDAAADRLLRTTDLLDYNSPYAWMGWVYLVSDLDATSIFWALDNTSTNSEIIITTADGTTIQSFVRVAGATTTANGPSLSVATWYHVASVRENVTSHKLYVDGALVATNTRDVTGRTANNRMEHGAYTTGNLSRSDSRVATIKAWSAALTIDEINAERWSIRPQRTDSLYGWWPCFPGSGERARDYSGNARNWTESGTLTDEDPSPVSWGAAATRLIAPAAAVIAGQPMALRHILDRTGARSIGRGVS